MDYDGGLPYDESDAAAAAAAAASAPAPAVPVEADDDGDLPMLDRPLDDFPLGDDNNRGSRREPMSASANDLMKRMGRGKVYMADESPGIFFNDGEQRISKDPVGSTSATLTTASEQTRKRARQPRPRPVAGLDHRSTR